MTSRYLQDVQKEAREISDQEMYVQTASRRRVQVQLLGEEQIRDHQACLEVATQATLDSARVSSIVSLPYDRDLSMPMAMAIYCDICAASHGIFASLKGKIMILRCDRARPAFCIALHHGYRSSAWKQICCPAGRRYPGWLRSCLRSAAWT